MWIGHVCPSFRKPGPPWNAVKNKDWYQSPSLGVENDPVTDEECFCPDRKIYPFYKTDGRGPLKKLPAILPKPEIQQLPFPKQVWTCKFFVRISRLSWTMQGQMV